MWGISRLTDKWLASPGLSSMELVSKFKVHLSWTVVGIKYPVSLKDNMLGAVFLIVLGTRRFAELI